MFDPAKQVSLCDATVKDLIVKLLDMPQDAVICCCGMSQLYLHCEMDRSAVSIDHASHDEWYPEPGSPEDIAAYAVSQSIKSSATGAWTISCREIGFHVAQSAGADHLFDDWDGALKAIQNRPEVKEANYDPFIGAFYIVLTDACRKGRCV